MSQQIHRTSYVALLLLLGHGVSVLTAVAGADFGSQAPVTATDPLTLHSERQRDPYAPTPPQPPAGRMAPTGPIVRGPFVSVQVNVDTFGNNIWGDAANEPSIAVDPTNPNRIVIGWRQFDSVASDFRQAGYGYSHDGGKSWTFPSVLQPAVFRSDPVLDVDTEGVFYYYSLRGHNYGFECDLFRSIDGGVNWLVPVYAFGGDKPWIAIDRTEGIGRGNIYALWSQFTRSIDGGDSSSEPSTVPCVGLGTLTVAPDGTLYTVSIGLVVAKSTVAQDPTTPPPIPFIDLGTVDLGGPTGGPESPNPGGLLRQPWIATDHSSGWTHGNVYVLRTASFTDSADVLFARSEDEGLSWTEPVRVNDDSEDNDAWQWFAMMAVSPNGRIDAVWNDTRNTGVVN
ncbi:MAG: exo-alpha-sialidase, partial [Planctomycetes bacterium]|nr:exo-alpha-sialidase [Planctomycetota bacterium]